MPQLDLTTYPPQLVWLAITFVLLYILMAKLALPRVTATILRREKLIDEDLDRAAKLKAEIDLTIHAYEKALAEARAAANATVAETKDRMAKLAAEKQQQTMAVLAEKMAAAESRIAAAKADAMANVRAIATDAARAASQRLLADPLDSALDEQRLEQAVDQALRSRN